MGLDQQTLQTISTELDQRLRTLKGNVSRDLSATHSEGSHTPGGVDTGDESIYEQRTHMMLSKTGMDANEIRLVEEALQRIQEGNYGVCIDCGTEIDKKRLVANPIASRCIDCQSRHEDDRDERDSTPSM